MVRSLANSLVFSSQIFSTREMPERVCGRGQSDSSFCRSAKACERRPLLIDPGNCTSLESRPWEKAWQCLSLWDTRPGQHGSQQLLGGKMPRKQQRNVVICVFGGNAAVVVPMALLAGIGWQGVGRVVQLERTGSVQSLPKCRSSFLIFPF